MIFNDGGGIFADDPRDREPDEEELQRHILERNKKWNKLSELTS